MIIERTICHESRQRITSLTTDRPILSLLCVIMWPTRYDDVLWKPILSRDILASCEGKQNLLNSHDYSGIKFLKRFSNVVYPIQYTQEHPMQGRARVFQGELPKWLQRIVEHEKICHHEKVYMVSGKKLTRKNRRDLIEISRKNMRFEGTGNTVYNSMLIDYLNNLPTNHFTSMLANIHKATETVESLKLLPRHRAPLEVIKQQQRNILERIKILVPLYKSTDNSPRIFDIGAELQFLQHDIRKVLMKGTMESDLVSAHFAICAKLWEAEKCQQFLKNGGKIWQELGKLYEGEVKEILKPALYSIAYDMNMREVRAFLERHGLDGRLFCEHELIQDLVRAREDMKAIIKLNGGHYDAFGKWIKLEEKLKTPRGNKRFKPYPKKNYGQVLAQLSQAYELALLAPIIEAAMAKDADFTILLWSHDGFTWKPKYDNNQSRAAISKKLQKLVEEKAEGLGIITSLETEEN